MTRREQIIERIANLDNDELVELVSEALCPNDMKCGNHTNCRACWRSYLGETEEE